MKNAIVINKQTLPIKECNGQRVITFKDIDNVHVRPSGTAHRNFKANRSRFIEGVDYFGRNSSEAKKEFGITAPNGLTLLTETGYLMLAKSLTDDLAWKVQRELVNSYFRVKAQQECAQMTFDDYEYFDKTYRGEPVLSFADISYHVGLNRYQCLKAIKDTREGSDYYFLRREDIAEFKRENPTVNKLISELYVVTKQGLKSICEYYGIRVEKSEAPENKKTEYCIIRDNSFMQGEAERIKNYLIAISVELDRCNRYNISVEKMNLMRKNLIGMAQDLESRVRVFANHKLDVTTHLV